MTQLQPADGLAASLWRGRHGRTTVGVFSLAFLFAFEALAVATVMPDVADDLDGLRWYAVAFAAPLAAAVLALATAGAAVDRLGPAPVLRRGLLVFCVGVALAGLAPTMPVFVAGRLVHGYGGGLLGVALYVVIAQAYPRELRPRVFAVLTTAWVLPALVGPLVAARVADTVGWRWVFLGVPALALAAWVLVADAPSRPGEAGATPRRAWRAPGMPAVIGSRAAIGTAFAAAEVYVPLLLTLDRGLGLTAAGWVLTTGAVTWSGGAVLAARWHRLADQPARVRLGAVLLAAGVATFALVAVPGVPLAVPVLGWAVAGMGIGMSFSTLSVLALATARPGQEGSASSALQLTDHVANVAGLGVGALVFARLSETAPVAAATGLVLAAAVVGATALLPARRLRA